MFVTVPSEPVIDWTQARSLEGGSGLRVPVLNATPEWCIAFKGAVETRRHATFQDPWGQIGLIGVEIFVPGVPSGTEALLKQTLVELVAAAQRRVAMSPPPESPEKMLELMRSLAG
jgi:hypothetical protein